jgi:gliding motility-associated protein GldM
MAQQKLSPRQRMINMRYLVLTALLALNVSKETLDVIAKVDKGLVQTNENFASRNGLAYAHFEKANAINPIKVGPFKIKADSLRVKSQELIDLINKYKWDIVSRADGEDARIDSIDNQDDLNTPANIMIVENEGAGNMKRGEILKQSIVDFKEFLYTLIDPDDTVLLSNIQSSLDVSDIPASGKEPSRSWEQDNFEYLPLIGVITLMSKMQSDIRNAESDILQHLYKEIDEASFTFNQLVPAVVPESNRIIAGSSFNAEIFLSAVDTTQDPLVTVSNRELSVVDGKGVYTVPNPGVGKHKWGGIIQYKAPDGRIIPYEFEHEFEVLPASLIISPTKMNVFFQGLENPVQISAIGAAPENTRVSITNADIRRVQGFNWIVEPKQNYGEAVIRVTATIDGRTQTYEAQRFRLKRVPNPVAMVKDMAGGTILKNSLVAQVGVEARLEDFLFDYKYEVQRFIVTSTVNNFTESEPASGYRFTQKQKNLISQVPKGGFVIIEEIFALGPDGEERKLPPISFKIQ